MTVTDVAFLTTCEACNTPTACMPGPRNSHGRPAPPNGYELGFEIEQAERSFVLCEPCLANVLHAAA